MNENMSVKIKEFKNAKVGDLLGFDGKGWVPVDISKVLQEVTKQIKDLTSQLEDAKILYNNHMLQMNKKTLDMENKYNDMKNSVISSVLELKNLIEEKDNEGDPL
jgi:hypothetical protein